MPHFPALRGQLTEQEVVDSFGGYDHRARIRDGAWYETRNLTSDFAPMLASRVRRANTHLAACALLEKGALAYVSPEGTLYYDFLPTGVTGLAPGPKQLVSMGAYLLIFPDKVYFNTADSGDWGSMEAHLSASTLGYEMCRYDGTDVEARFLQPDAPENPDNADYWIDTSGEKPRLRQWSEAVGDWVSVESVYLRIRLSTMGVLPRLFAVNDGVRISGSACGDVNGDKQIIALGGGENENDWLLVTGLLRETVQNTLLHIDRSVPALDFVCECRNRLWGCRYGLDENGEPVNEILCCALGDFRNWRQYAGLATDSWAGSVGSDGPWTGAVNFLGCPTFFKENRIHRLAVSPEGAHQITETVCRGVQKGSEKSLVVVNETLYYKSAADVCAYQGGFPESVSAALGSEVYHAAAAGALRGKYYLSMKDENEGGALFVYDIEKGLWMHEDDFYADGFARVGSELYALAAGTLWTMTGSLPVPGTEREEAPDWAAESGLLYGVLPENKRVSRYNIRLRLGRGSSVAVEVEYDSDGIWRSAGSISAENAATATYLFPVRPRRCDHLRLRLSGRGEVKIYSIARILEPGSDYR